MAGDSRLTTVYSKQVVRFVFEIPALSQISFSTELLTLLAKTFAINVDEAGGSLRTQWNIRIFWTDTVG